MFIWTEYSIKILHIIKLASATPAARKLCICPHILGDEYNYTSHSKRKQVLSYDGRSYQCLLQGNKRDFKLYIFNYV